MSKRWHDYFAWEREYKKLEAKNKRLRDFAEYVVRQTTDTCNAGVVLVNTTPGMLREKAEQALQKDK